MSVKKRRDKWHYDFTVRGFRYRGSIPEALNKAQAVRAETQIRNAIYERRFGDGIKKNFAQFVEEEYKPWARANKKSYKTTDRFHVSTLVAFFKNHALSEISPLLIERFKRERAASRTIGDKPRKPASVNRELATLSRILSMARDNGLIQQNPSSKVKRLKENNERTRYLTDEEEAQLMATLTGRFSRLRPIVVIALGTGMRQAEIVNLTWRQIDWQRNLIRVMKTKNSHDRTIPVTTTVKELLLTLWRERTEGEARVFQIEASAVQQSFARLAKRAKLVDFRFHDLRHTFGTRLAELGVDAFTLAALLGHRTLAMTQRYVHPSDEGKRRAISALENYNSGHKSVTIRAVDRQSKAVEG